MSAMNSVMKIPKNKREYTAALKRAEAASIRRIAEHIRSPHRQRSADEVQADLANFAVMREEDATYAEKGARPDLDAMIADCFRNP